MSLELNLKHTSAILHLKRPYSMKSGHYVRQTVLGVQELDEGIAVNNLAHVHSKAPFVIMTRQQYSEI